MATIVAGFAASYSPQLHVPSASWEEMGRDDIDALQTEPNLTHSPPNHVRTPIVTAIGADDQAAQQRRCQELIAKVALWIADLELDVLVMIGEDEQHLVDEACGRETLVYLGHHVPYHFGTMPTASKWAYGATAKRYLGEPGLASHIFSRIRRAAPDVEGVSILPVGRGIGHHVGFLGTRLLQGRRVPIVPILFNSTRLPAPAMAYRIGEAIRDGIATARGDVRVGICAIGGLSHITIDESLDKRLLDAIARKSAVDLIRLPADGGTLSHAHNRPWITAASALSDLRMSLLDYVPAYRSAAGTGCGMAFALWN